MTEPIVARRIVYHIGGYDFTMPVDAVHRRFVRELRRFEATWSVKAVASPPTIGADVASWDVVTNGPNWRVETSYRFVRWDDVIEADGRRPMWRRLALGLLTGVDFIAGGALWGYCRTNWRYALFFLYPYVLLALMGVIAWLVGGAVGRAVGSGAAGTLVAIAVALPVFVALLYGLGRLLLLQQIFDDWIFARTYIRTGEPVLDRRLDRLAQELSDAARAGNVDEILIVGHSLGAVLGIDLIDRALKLDAALGQSGTRLAFLSVGSSILKVGLHRGASRFHAAVTRVASTPAVFWAEYQALTDVMNFYKTDPVDEMGLTATHHPVIRQVRIKHMLNPDYYRRMRRNFFRVHCQFISANDRRASYDYFMLLCGPLTAERQARLPEGAVTEFGTDGALLESGASTPHASEHSAQAGR